jgi:adenylate cyclase
MAIQHFETSMRLSPRHGFAICLAGIGNAHFFNGRLEAAAAKLLASLEQFPNLAITYRLLAACYAHMGRLEEARDIVERLKTISPVLIPRLTRFRSAEHRDLFLSGLRLAAGEAI